MIRFVLCWDIDGTLLTTARAGIAAWEGAFSAIANKPLCLANYTTAGLTDVEIATKLAQEINDSPQTVQQLLRGYEDRLPDCLPLRQGTVMPGIMDILNQLQKMPWIYSILLTGNTARGAAAKLSHYGLHHFFDLGAYSDNLPDRPSIAKKAATLIAERFGDQTRPTFFVIGDTPHDIHCGDAIGAKTVAVCTGTYTREALSDHKPWRVFDSFAHPTDFFAELGLTCRDE